MLVANSTTGQATMSIGEKVFYANLVVMVVAIAVFSVVYLLSFNNPSIDEYKAFAKDALQVYAGVIPLLSLMLYKQFKKTSENQQENENIESS